MAERDYFQIAEQAIGAVRFYGRHYASGPPYQERLEEIVEILRHLYRTGMQHASTEKNLWGLTFLGHLDAGEFEAGQESLDVRLFDRQDIPWDEIAFPVVRDALRRYVEDVTSGIFRLYVADLPHRLF